jgi:hypothetical protein
MQAPADVLEPTEPAAEPDAAPEEPEPELEPAPEPEPPAPEQPDTQALPSYDASIPAYADDTPEPFIIPPRTPPDGHGRIAVGGIMWGGGIALVGVSGIMIMIDEDLAAWIPGAVIGSAAIIGGIGSVIAGHQRRKQYSEWASEHGGGGKIPASGIGLVASGITCVAAGTFGVIVGGVSLGVFQGNGDLPYGQVLLPLAAVSVVTGAGLLGAGVARQRKYKRWDGQRTLTPVVAPMGDQGRATGASFGVAGRF